MHSTGIYTKDKNMFRSSILLYYAANGFAKRIKVFHINLSV